MLISSQWQDEMAHIIYFASIYIEYTKITIMINYWMTMAAMRMKSTSGREEKDNYILEINLIKQWHLGEFWVLFVIGKF